MEHPSVLSRSATRSTTQMASTPTREWASVTHFFRGLKVVTRMKLQGVGSRLSIPGRRVVDGGNGGKRGVETKADQIRSPIYAFLPVLCLTFIGLAPHLPNQCRRPSPHAFEAEQELLHDQVTVDDLQVAYKITEIPAESSQHYITLAHHLLISLFYYTYCQKKILWYIEEARKGENTSYHIYSMKPRFLMAKF